MNDMTHYYLYIKAGLQIDAHTVFYKVGVGESEAQNRKRLWLQAFAHEHGHFFVRWTLDAVQFLLLCKQSIGLDDCHTIHLDAETLVRILRTGCEEPASFQAELNRHRMLMQIDHDYYFYHTVRNKRQQLISGEASSK